ncbi:hypothetical protein [Granulicella arctica]|nr:hypothetical protein [Granulicella arctica]
MTIWTRRDFNRGVTGSLCALSFGPQMMAEEKATGSRFVHPGMLHGAADIKQIKRAQCQKEEPIYS